MSKRTKENNDVNEANKLYAQVIALSRDSKPIDEIKARLINEYALDALALFGTTNQERKLELKRIIDMTEQVIPPDSIDNFKKRAEKIILRLFYPRNIRLRNALLTTVGIIILISILLPIFSLFWEGKPTEATINGDQNSTSQSGGKPNDSSASRQQQEKKKEQSEIDDNKNPQMPEDKPSPPKAKLDKVDFHRSADELISILNSRSQAINTDMLAQEEQWKRYPNSEKAKEIVSSIERKRVQFLDLQRQHVSAIESGKLVLADQIKSQILSLLDSQNMYLREPRELFEYRTDEYPGYRPSDVKNHTEKTQLISKIWGDTPSLEEAIQSSSKTINDKNAKEEAQRRALETLAKICPAKSDYVPVLVNVLKHPLADQFIMESVGLKLCRLGREARHSIPELITSLKEKDDDPRERRHYYSLRVLSCIRPDAEQAIPTIVELARNSQSDFNLRVLAIKVLATFGEKAKSAIPILIELQKDEKEQIRQEAQKALRQITPE